LIEAAACGCPVVMGPSTFNFAQAAEQALQAGVARREADLEAAVLRALTLLALDPPEAAALRDRARAYAASRRGAADRMAARILSLPR
jgi:3-deoxy-D-manno-octulosonic-acid transferase